MRRPFNLVQTAVQSLFLTYTFCILTYALTALIQTFEKDFFLTHMGSIVGTLFTSWFMIAAALAARPGWGERIPWMKLTFATSVVTFIVSVNVVDFSFRELFDAEGSAGAARLFSGLLNVNFGLLPEALYEMAETVLVAFLATAIAVPLAFAASFLCARNLMRGLAAFSIYASLRAFFNLTRSVEPLIWAVIFSVWVGIGPFAGMLALMIHSIASLAKQYSEIIENASPGPIEAMRSTGANEVQVIWFGVVPQVLLPFIAFTFYRWDINVRMATVIGLVGGGGIGTLLMKYQGQAMWPEVGCIIFVIALVVWIMDAASTYVREALK